MAAPLKPPATGLFQPGSTGLMGEVSPEEEEATQKRRLLGQFKPLQRKQKQVQAIQHRGIVPIDEEGKALRPEPITPQFPMQTKETKGVMVPGQQRISGTDIIDFLAGSEMAVIGMKLDNQGFQWEWENMKQQWSEEPLWSNLLATTSLVGTMAFPAARAAYVTSKFGKVGKLLGKVAGDAEEIERFTALGMLEKGNKPSSKYLRLMRQQEHARSKYSDLAAKIDLDKAGKLEGLKPIEKLKYEFDKRFSNQYFNITNSFTEGTGFKDQYHKNLDELWKSEDMGKFFVDIPDVVDGPKIMQHYLHRISPGAVPNPRLTGTTLTWADNMYNARKAHQLEMVEDGFLTPDTVKRIGEAHFPALYKGTPEPTTEVSRSVLMPLRGKKPVTKYGEPVFKEEEATGLRKLLGGGVKYTVEQGDEYQYIALRTGKMPVLDGDTLKLRKSDIPDVYGKLLRDELVTDPADLTVRGHVMSKLYHNNFKLVRDLSMDLRYSISNFDIMAKYKTVDKAMKEGYVNFEHVGEGIAARLRRMIEKKGGNLGPNGELPWIRREVFDEIFDSSGMFAQTNRVSDMLELLTTIHKTSKTGLSIPTHFQNWAGNNVMLMQAGFNVLSPDNIKIQSSMAKAFNQIAEIHKISREAGHNTRAILDNVKINLGKLTIDGKTFDLREELLHPMVRDLIEESAFETTEGFAHLEKFHDRLKKDQYLTRAAAKTFLGLKKLTQLGDKKGFRWFDQMTKWYLGEDMVPKMSYYMKLRGQGLTRESAALEVGRRLPMYGTTGSAIKLGRKWAFPWASFPTEAMRITKNNMMDNPLRMVPWLHTPQIMQSLLSMADPSVGTSGQVEEAKRGLPFYAQNPTTVVSGTETAAGLGGGTTGALTGAVAGGIAGGPIGAGIGAGLGGYAGKKIAEYLSDDSSGDVLRGSILNWLPHSSFLLKTTSPDYTVGGSPAETLTQLQEQLPAEPLAILKPLMDVISGKTSFGADIGATGFGDQAGKAIAGFIGFLAPPWIQKYGLKTTTPDVTFSQQILGENIPGDFSNVSRGLIDVGLQFDPSTGKPGNLSLDFLLGNFGMWKSYASDPKTQLANEVSTDDNMEKIRSTWVKNLDYNLQNGNDDAAMEILTNMQSTFTRQYADNPKRAQLKWSEYLARLQKSIGKHPKLRRWSEDELLERQRMAWGFAGEERGKAREAVLRTIRDELMIRRISKSAKETEERGRAKPEGRGEKRER